MKIEWIDRGSTPILYADGRGLEKNELLSFVTRVHEKLRESTVKANEIHAIKSAFVGMNQINEKPIRRTNGCIYGMARYVRHPPRFRPRLWYHSLNLLGSFLYYAHA